MTEKEALGRAISEAAANGNSEQAQALQAVYDRLFGGGAERADSGGTGRP